MSDVNLQAIDFSRTDSLSRQEVGEFITHEMGLQQPNGEPQWSVGVATLVEHGMQLWKEESEIDPQTFEHELQSVYEEVHQLQHAYEEKIQDLRKEKEVLRKQLENERSTSPSS